jgi:hypothetical protein
MALTSWSWFWMQLETSVFCALGAVIASLDANYPVAALFLLVIALGVGGMFAALTRCQEYAAREVETILGDSERSTAIQSRFNALQGERKANPI